MILMKQTLKTKINEITFREDYSKADFLDEAKTLDMLSKILVPKEELEEMHSYWVDLMNQKDYNSDKRGELLGLSLKPFIEKLPGKFKNSITGKISGFLPFQKKK